jgi:hypothetical protein
MFRPPQESQTAALVKDASRFSTNTTRYIHKLLRHQPLNVDEHTFLPHVGLTLGEACTSLNLKKAVVPPVQHGGL